MGWDRRNRPFPARRRTLSTGHGGKPVLREDGFTGYLTTLAWGVVSASREWTKAEVMALLAGWELRELSAQEVHESAELLLDDAPVSPEWPGVEYMDPRWGPRTVVGLLTDLADALYFPADIPALRALLDDDVPASVREAEWEAYRDEVDWAQRARRATSLPYYNLWHRP